MITRHSTLLIMVMTLLSLSSGCSRQFAVSVNNQSVYDPRVAGGARQVADADLQGCINLALGQAGLGNAAELTVLSCPAAEVTDLRGIEQLSALRFLDLASNAITDLQPLAGLDRLTGLSVPDNPLNDISPLLTMNGLSAVILSGNTRIPCSQLDRLAQRLGANLTRPASCRQ